VSTTRFLSKYGRYTVGIRRQIIENYATGESRVLQQPLYAQFHEGGLRPEERELALATWVFNGSYQEQDEVTIVAPDYRIGLLDTEIAQMANGWSDDDRAEVENELARLSAESSTDMILVPKTLIPPPWPRYDDFPGTPEELVQRLIDDGHNFDAVITYERSMQNRPEVLAALNAGQGISEGLVEWEPEEEVVG